MDDDTETTTLLGHTIRDALSGVPEEVQDFMWSNEYKIIVDTIQKALSLTDKERDLLKYGSYQLLLGMKTMEQLSKEWVAAGMNPDLVIKVLYVVHQEILTRAQNITEFFTRDPNAPDEIDDEPDSSDTSTENKSITMNAAALSTLADRLKQASTALPAKPAGSTSGTLRTAIDPYHEAVDNE